MNVARVAGTTRAMRATALKGKIPWGLKPPPLKKIGFSRDLYVEYWNKTQNNWIIVAILKKKKKYEKTI